MGGRSHKKELPSRPWERAQAVDQPRMSRNPEAYPQTPPVQVCPARHACPHAPQFSLSLWRSKQPDGPWQHVSLSAQVEPPLHEQTLSGPILLHCSPGPHSVPLHVQIPEGTSHVPVAFGPVAQLAFDPHTHPPALHSKSPGQAFVHEPQ